MLEELNIAPKIEFLEELYSFSDGKSYLKCLQSGGPKCATLMMVGHNPSIQNLALLLTENRSVSKDVVAVRSKFPTAAIAVISMSIKSWQDADFGSGELLSFLTPSRDEEGP